MRPRQSPLLATLIVGAGVGVIAGGVAGYVIAARSNVSVVTGTFRVGDHQATAAVDGWNYGIVDSVPWLGSDNTWHEDGWPTCLGPVGALRTARFGYTTVQGPTVEWRQVVWIACP